MIQKIINLEVFGFENDRAKVISTKESSLINQGPDDSQCFKHQTIDGRPGDNEVVIARRPSGHHVTGPSKKNFIVFAKVVQGQREDGRRIGVVPSNLIGGPVVLNAVIVTDGGSVLLVLA